MIPLSLTLEHLMRSWQIVSERVNEVDGLVTRGRMLEVTCHHFLREIERFINTQRKKN